MIRNYLQSYMFRQLTAVALSGWLSLAAGFSFGFSAVLLSQLKSDENFPYDDNIASWIASITPLSMAIGCICAGSLIDRLGRKVGHIIVAVFTTISWLIIALATNVTLLLIGRFLAGLSAGTTKPVSLVYIGEITDPKYRSFSLVSPSLLLNVGILISHIIGEYITWKTNAYIYVAVNFVSFISTLYIKESPLWLISKGKIDEGVQAFKWLRGVDGDAEKELNLVLKRQTEESKRYFLKDILSKGFVKPFITSILLSAATQISGINSLTFYAKDILGNTVKGGVDPFILMIIFDIFRLLTFVIIFCLNKFIPRKIFFFSVSFSCSVVLFVLCACLSFLNISEYVWLSITLIIIYIALGGCIVALAWSFIPELFSKHLRGLGSGLSGSISFMLLFVFVKVSPSFISSYGEKAMYAGFGLITVINTIVLCFLLPETNGRTLQDIEDSYKKTNSKESTL